MMCADFKHEASHFISCIASEADLNELTRLYQKMEEDLVVLLEREGSPKETMKFIRGASMRYYGQLYEVDATMSTRNNSGPVTRDDLDALIKDFHGEHQQRYGHSEETMPTQIRSVKVTAMGVRVKIQMLEQPLSDEDSSKAIKRKRSVFFKEQGGFKEIPCYDGDKLIPGNTIVGPAIVEEKTTTLVIPPKAKVIVDRYGNYVGQLQ
jgi:N-methylhydantoinase A